MMLLIPRPRRGWRMADGIRIDGSNLIHLNDTNPILRESLPRKGILTEQSVLLTRELTESVF